LFYSCYTGVKKNLDRRAAERCTDGLSQCDCIIEKRKTSLSRSKILLIALFFILILAFIYLFMDYFKEQRTNRSLANQIDVTTQTLNLIAVPSAGLSEQLRQAHVANGIARQSFSGNWTDTIAIINSIYQAVAEFHLSADPFSADRWIVRNVGAGTYRMLPFELTVEGSLADYILFIEKLGDKRIFPNLAIDSSSVTNNAVVGQTAAGIPGSVQGITALLAISVVERQESGY
jgi:hypothetical protein